MDERERGNIREELLNLPCKVHIETLSKGDYLLSDYHIIERKRGDDFVASIYDYRLFQQLQMMKNAYPYPLLLLEDSKKMFLREFIKKESVFGAMVYINYKLGIPIIPSNTTKESAQIIYNYAKLIQSKMNPPSIQTSDLIVCEPDTVSREDQSFFLQGLIDTGTIKANRFLDIFRTPEFLFHAIDSTEFEYTCGGNPKKITGIMESIHGIGVKYLDRNKRLLNSSYSNNKQNKLKTRR